LDNVTLTFLQRNNETLELLTQYALPDLKRHPFIRIWDAGCATGPEPYSIAMMLRENMGHSLFRNVLIYATDIDEGNFGTHTARGVYPELELGRIPRDLFKKYFAPNGKPGYFQVSEELRRAVHFHRHDLLSLLPIREDLGLIVCKNVLLQLTPAQRVDVIRMFHRALVKDGLLIVEQTQKLPDAMQPLFQPINNTRQLFRKV
jgi:chemotaxis protein methyltransferase CheR